MRPLECGSARGLLPDHVAGVLAAPEKGRLEAHVTGCAECQAELEVVAALRAAWLEPPAGSVERVRAALRSELGSSAAPPPRIPWLRPSWGLAAAALVVLGATSVLLRGNAVEDMDPLLAALEGAPSVWLAEEGAVAGALVLDELSDEELTSLLEEFEG